MSSSITSWIASSADKFKSMFFKAFSYFDKHGTIYSFHMVDNEESELLFKVGRMSWPLEERKTETLYLMGQKGDTSPSDLIFDKFPACSPSLQALTEVPLLSQLSIPHTICHHLSSSVAVTSALSQPSTAQIFINSHLLTSNHCHLASASPEHPSLSGFIAETLSVVFCLPFSGIILCLQ
uniref:Uncharacterized protein n=1 Tax=Moniliophthora roreri TaxID=221103 RepID=A0A0W0G2X8_MONRR